MNIDGRKLVFKPRFYGSLDETLSFLEQYNSHQFIQKFLKDLDSFIIEKVAPRPEYHTEYRWMRTPEKVYRRAIFRKKYYIVYKLTPESIDFLAFVSAKQDLENLPIQD